jgi:hypothetical protein
MNSICAKLCLLILLPAFLYAEESYVILHRQTFNEATNGNLPGWRRLGGYDKVIKLLEEAHTSASGTISLPLESHQWGPGENDGIDTVVTGDTGARYEPNTAYKVEFLVARAFTAPGGRNSSPFFGEIYFELWAGDPNAGGTLLGTMKDPSSDQISEDRRILTLKTERTSSGSGHLFIRVGSVNRLAPGAEPYVYQQAEIDDITIFSSPLVSPGQ